MTRRLLIAFLRRDAIIQLSYRTKLVMDLLTIVVSVTTFHFVAQVFGSSASPVLAGYGGKYFPFVLVGLAFSAYQSVGLFSFSQSIRQEQYLGTLESILSAPLTVSEFLAGSIQWDFLDATLHVLLYFAAAALLFGLRLPDANWGAALFVLALTLCAFLSLGVLSAAFILRFKRGDPIAWMVGTVSGLLGRVYFPVSVLPPWLKALSFFVPMTHALEALRRTLLQGAGLSDVRRSLAALAAFTALILPLGLLLFQKALDSARRDGSLGHY